MICQETKTARTAVILTNRHPTANGKTNWAVETRQKVTPKLRTRESVGPAEKQKTAVCSYLATLVPKQGQRRLPQLVCDWNSHRSNGLCVAERALWAL